MRGVFVPILLGYLALPGCGAKAAPPEIVPRSAASASPAPPSTALVQAGSAGSSKADRMKNSLWGGCYAGFKRSSPDLAADVKRLGQTCAEITKMHPLGEPQKGTQSATTPAQSFKFKALATHCYRVYGVAGAGITNLDLLIRDSDGAVAGEDSTDDATPVVLGNGAICFKQDDDASAVVSVGAGQGDYAVQVWTD